MKIKIIVLTILIAMAATIAAAVGFIYSGSYDVAASQPDSGLLHWVLVTTRDRSIERRAAGINAPPLTDPKLIQEGFEHYHEMCEGCHLAPGIASSEIRAGLNPQPPILAQVVPRSSPARLFLVIKDGVRMTGMPAWGTTHSDPMIWAMVAFLERLPEMTPAEYRAMARQAGAEPNLHL
jgi:mono/diheme cytochrome c family protein